MTPVLPLTGNSLPKYTPISASFGIAKITHVSGMTTSTWILPTTLETVSLFDRRYFSETMRKPRTSPHTT